MNGEYLGVNMEKVLKIGTVVGKGGKVVVEIVGVVGYWVSNRVLRERKMGVQTFSRSHGPCYDGRAHHHSKRKNCVLVFCA